MMSWHHLAFALAFTLFFILQTRLRPPPSVVDGEKPRLSWKRIAILMGLFLVLVLLFLISFRLE
jgi:hypothetical protein